MPDLERRDLVPPGKVEVGLRHGVRGGVEPAPKARRSVRERSADHLDQDERPYRATQRMGQPWRQIEPGAEVAPEGGSKRCPDQEGRQIVATENPPRVGERPGHGPNQQQDQRQAEPTLVGTHAFDDPADHSRLVEGRRFALGSVDLRAPRRDLDAHASTAPRLSPARTW